MAKASDLDIETLITGARAAGTGRRAGLTDDQIMELAELQTELADLEATRVELTDRRASGEAIDTRLLIEVRNRQKALRRQANRIEQRAAHNFNRQRKLSPEDRNQLAAAGVDPERFLEAQADELRAIGIQLLIQYHYCHEICRSMAHFHSPFFFVCSPTNENFFTVTIASHC